MKKIYVIHENDAWVDPLRAAFAEFNLPYAEWFLNQGVLDFSIGPPDGVFYNRMSASSHTRGHRYAPEYTAAVLAWLEQHGRRVVNNGRALQLEISKIAQYAALATTRHPHPAHERSCRPPAHRRSRARFQWLLHHQAQSGRQGPGRAPLS